MLLINALVDPEAVDDLDVRVALRNQLYQAGLTHILNKMEELNSELLHRKIDEFRELEEHDAALIYGDMVLNDVLDPPEILDNILTAITGTEAYDLLRSILQHLMLVPDDAEIRYIYTLLLYSRSNVYFLQGPIATVFLNQLSARSFSNKLVCLTNRMVLMASQWMLLFQSLLKKMNLTRLWKMLVNICKPLRVLRRSRLKVQVSKQIYFW